MINLGCLPTKDNLIQIKNPPNFIEGLSNCLNVLNLKNKPLHELQNKHKQKSPPFTVSLSEI
jgi:hypothetical protein